MPDAVMSVSTLSSLPVFPFAERFPYVSDDESLNLAQDIEENGLVHPIVLIELPDENGEPTPYLLDGRNRLRALARTNLTQVAVSWFDGTRADAVFFVLSSNVRRRHLEPDFLAGLAVDAEVLWACEERAESQRRATQGRPSNDEKLTQKIVEVSSRSDREAKAMAAEAVGGTNREYVRQMAKLQEAAPDLYAEVMARTMQLSGKNGAWQAYQARIAPGPGATAGNKNSNDAPHDRFEKRVDRAITNLADAIEDHVAAGLWRADDTRYVESNLLNLLRIVRGQSA